MWLKVRTGLLIGRIILLALSLFYYHEIVYLPGRIIGFLLVGVEIIEHLLNKMAFPNLDIDEEEHQIQALRIVSRHMKVIVCFLHNDLENDEHNYVIVGKYLFSIKLTNSETQMIQDVLSKYESLGGSR